MISDKFKCIFIHIPKTAGSSIELFFDEYPEEQHVLATKCISLYGKQKWSKYYRFAFVRNPWDRIVSWFLWSNRDCFHYNWKTAAGFGTWANKQTEWGIGGGHPKVQEGWYTSLKDDFERFVLSIENTKDKDDYDLLIKGNAYKGKWIASQSTWIKNSRGKMVLDFVGKYENLEQDFKKVCTKLNIKYQPLAKAKVLYNRPHYSNFYNKKTKERIAKLYDDDIRNFNYRYEEKNETKHKM